MAVTFKQLIGRMIKAIRYLLEIVANIVQHNDFINQLWNESLT